MSTQPEPPHAEPSKGAVLPCGWGRLIFAHTFVDPRDVAQELLQETVGTRDIAFYATDPHIVLNTAPQDLFMDPSHTYRILFSDYRKRPDPSSNVVIRPLSGPDEVAEINRIYQAQRMVPVDPSQVEQVAGDNRLQFVVATQPDDSRILGVALGVDHHHTFQDIENGSSLWSLAVDPQTSVPGVGESLVRYFIELYQTRGRAQLDLSVLYNNTEAIALYEKLGFQRVPIFAIKRANPINERLYTGHDPSEDFNPYARILIDEALRRGISVEPLHAKEGYFRLNLGGRRITCRESLSDLTSAVAMSLCDDKAMTRRILQHAGLSLPAQIHASNPQDHAVFLNKWKRIVVKPARGEQGRGVAVNLTGEDQVEAAVQDARRHCSEVLLEQFVAGTDLRVVVIHYEVVAAAIRQPPEITGTGTRTVRQLIERTSRRRAAATGGESKIPMDAETERCLQEQGLDWESILEDGRVIQVRNTANLHTGGTIHDVTDKLHPNLATAAVSAARALEIPVVGMDFLVPDVAGPEYVIIEANERPGLANHEPQPTAERFIDLLFPQTARLRPLSPLSQIASPAPPDSSGAQPASTS
jgi:GNAT-family acetyltransferase (TIGR03103 family)